jgi:hypothetical protein
MKWVISFLSVLIYASALIVGVTLMFHRSDSVKSGFEASHGMPFNHLIQPGDVVPAWWYFPTLAEKGPQSRGLVGRYTRRYVIAGQVITAEDTSGTPAVTSQPGFAYVILPVQHSIVVAGDVDANKLPPLCRGDQLIDDSLHAVAVLCPASEKQNCSVIVEVRNANAPALLAKTGDNVFCVKK